MAPHSPGWWRRARTGAASYYDYAAGGSVSAMAARRDSRIIAAMTRLRHGMYGIMRMLSACSLAARSVFGANPFAGASAARWLSSTKWRSAAVYPDKSELDEPAEGRTEPEPAEDEPATDAPTAAAASPATGTSPAAGPPTDAPTA